jgi:hypothetical protein
VRVFPVSDFENQQRNRAGWGIPAAIVSAPITRNGKKPSRGGGEARATNRRGDVPCKGPRRYHRCDGIRPNSDPRERFGNLLLTPDSLLLQTACSGSVPFGHR